MLITVDSVYLDGDYQEPDSSQLPPSPMVEEINDCRCVILWRSITNVHMPHVHFIQLDLIARSLARSTLKHTSSPSPQPTTTTTVLNRRVFNSRSEKKRWRWYARCSGVTELVPVCLLTRLDFVVCHVRYTRSAATALYKIHF